VSHCNGDVLVFLNNDTEVISHDWLETMVGHAMQPEVGAVGAKLLFPDDTV
jgi:GT2 family glycosyltransferase